MKYYLTVPIYYVNAAPHIGHFYTTMAADVLKRFKIMQGYDVVLTTGSDEHGQNVERAARLLGKTPEEYATLISQEFRETWQKTGLLVDRFMRTSDPQHHAKVRWLFERCRENGYIEKGSYTGQYCFNCELYVNEAQAGDPCPDCGRTTETVTEENYFFKLSAFQDRLLRLYEEQPQFIQPEIRRNEVISFVRQGLRDLSITRTSIKWGIPVPVEGHHVFYVWFDALITYMSAVEGSDLWPADLHLIGKEIVRFHAVYWPAFLMAAGLPLPKQIFAHGWLLFDGMKMSKTRGNIVRATPIQQAMGIDALRYYLLREVPFGADGNFTYEALVSRYNADLANGLGNLVSRTLSMIQQYRQGIIPGAGQEPSCEPVAAKAREVLASYPASMEAFEFSRALESVWQLLATADKFIVTQAPWTLAKNPEASSKLEATLYTAAEVVRLVTALLYPILPHSAAKIWSQLGMTTPIDQVRLGDLAWGGLPPGQKIGKPEGVFPRLDPKATVARLLDLEEAERERQDALVGKKLVAKTPAAAPEGGDRGAGMREGVAPIAPEITIDDFAKVDLRVARVLDAQPVAGADKLLQLQVDLGEAQPRTIVAGIALAYKPEQLVGRKVVIVANLAPRKLRGLVSQGMIVAASLEGGQPVLAGFLEDVPVGARLK
ncbi:MAG: methionine--tRNA ligase [Bryobacteraceae bacterium]|nr:methionine--tRNA ligase [Bryobacteraceae bacterium]MDW8378207.1 methionine--tRNA ligase [Bryobacterales bacterium]